MKPHLLLLLVLALPLLSACADHEAGYHDGYAGRDAGIRLLVGGKDYRAGYQQGQMQASHDDWYAENLDDMDFSLSCPAVVMRAEPVIFSEDRGPISLN